MTKRKFQSMEDVGLTEDDKQAWRMNPSESLSDYTIEIHHSLKLGSKNVRKDVYHVHKAYLSVGPYYSCYFNTLLAQKKDSRYTENLNDTSIINLPRISAEAFPALLDFVYSQGQQCSFKDNPLATVGVYHLSDYFDIPKSRAKCLDLVRQDVTSKHFSKYYEYALQLKLTGMIEEIEKVIGQNPKHFLKDHSIWSILTTGSMKKVITADYRSTSRGCSVVISFFEQTKNDVSIDDLYNLTHDLENFSLNNAIKFIDLENKLKGGHLDPKRESSLRKRCLEAVRDNMDYIDFWNKESKVVTCLMNNPSKTLIEILIDNLRPLPCKKRMFSDDTDDSDDADDSDDFDDTVPQGEVLHFW